MDKNTITGIILIFAIFIGFSIYNNNRQNKAFEAAVKTAETEVVNGNFERARTEYVNALRFKPNNPEVLEKINELNIKLGIVPGQQVTDTTRAKVDSLAVIPAAQAEKSGDPGQYGIFSGAAKGEEDFITLENNKLELKISLKGGRVYSARLKDYVTWDSLPLILFSGDSTVFGFNFFTADNKAIRTNNLYFKPVSDEKSFVVTSQPLSVNLRLYADTGKYIEYKYTLSPDKYSVTYDVTFKNMQGILPQNQTSIMLDWQMYLPQQEKGRTNEENYGTDMKYKYYQGDVEWLKQRQQKELEKADIPMKLSWVAFVDQFFSTIVINEDHFLNGSISSTRTLTSKKYIRYFTSEMGVPFTPGADTKLKLKLYFGPNHISTLKKEGYQLEKIVFLGRSVIGWISRFVIIPIFQLARKIYQQLWSDNFDTYYYYKSCSLSSHL